MKLFADMHVHSKFSIDGTSTMEEYCLTAEKTGSRIICFTEHVDFNSMEKNLSIIKDNRTQNFVVDDYFCEINRLRKKYSSLTLLSGIEFSEPHLFPHEFAKYCAYPFDCITAGIHHCNNAAFPGARNLPVTEALDEYYNIMLKTMLKDRYTEMGLVTEEDDETPVYHPNHLNQALKWVLAADIVSLECFDKKKDLAIIPYKLADKDEPAGFDFIFVWEDDGRWCWEKVFYTSDDPFGSLQDDAKQLYDLIESSEFDAKLSPKVHQLISDYVQGGRPE